MRDEREGWDMRLQFVSSTFSVESVVVVFGANCADGMSDCVV